MKFLVMITPPIYLWVGDIDSSKESILQRFFNVYLANLPLTSEVLGPGAVVPAAPLVSNPKIVSCD